MQDSLQVKGKSKVPVLNKAPHHKNIETTILCGHQCLSIRGHTDSKLLLCCIRNGEIVLLSNMQNSLRHALYLSPVMQK